MPRSRWGEPPYYSGYDEWDFPPSRPREAKGGIKAHSKQGSFGQHWWAKRWIAVLEGFNLGARLTRGRSYARQGQVLSIVIEQGAVSARVQGSRPRPYDICIQLRTLRAREWERVVQVISSQALFAAKLLNGEMPQEIEGAFTQARVSLFPQTYQDLETSCSCPDWSNPCKHIAAVYYLLAEEFDRDPFLLFTLRGLERDELLGRLGALHPQTAADEPSPPEEFALSEEGTSPQSDLATFWTGQPLNEAIPGEVSLPPVAGALLRRLGPFPFWRGAISVQESLNTLYTTASEGGLGVVAGEVPPVIRTMVGQHPHGPTSISGPASKTRKTKEGVRAARGKSRRVNNSSKEGGKEISR